jgi:hypothetical protein
VVQISSGSPTTTYSPTQYRIPVGAPGSVLTNSAITDNGIVSIAETVEVPGGTVILGSNGTASGYLLLQGASSGSMGLTTPNTSAATPFLYVLPTSVSSGAFLQDQGSTTCPALAAGAPTNCELLGWQAGALAVNSYAGLTAPSVSVVDNGDGGGTLLANTQYCYQVTAYNNVGTTTATGNHCVTTANDAINTHSITVTASGVTGTPITGYSFYGRLNVTDCDGALNGCRYIISQSSASWVDTGSPATVSNTSALIAVNTTNSIGFGPASAPTGQYQNGTPNTIWLAQVNNYTLALVGGYTGNNGPTLEFAPGGTGSAGTINYQGGNPQFNFSSSIQATGSLVASGPLNLASTQTTVSGSTSGTAIFSEPFAGTSFKRVVIYLNALLGTASYTYPTAFTDTPSCVATSAVACSVLTSTSTTAVTVTGATTTGFIFLEGY